MNAYYIKTCVLCWLRFSKSVSIISTEVGKYSSDVLYVRKQELHEIEVKVSISDFRNDFKKPKHFEYKHPKNPWSPNYFWFAVTPSIAPVVLAELTGTKYGLLVARSTADGYHRWNDRVKVLKKAEIFHDRPCQNSVKATIVHRMASELCNFFINSWGTKS